MKYFRLGDNLTLAESERLGLKHRLMMSWEPPDRDGTYARAKFAHEFRPPRKGEWYLSGATPVAYRAPNDLGSAYNIMRLVAIRRRTRVEIAELPGEAG